MASDLAMLKVRQLKGTVAIYGNGMFPWPQRSLLSMEWFRLAQAINLPAPQL